MLRKDILQNARKPKAIVQFALLGMIGRHVSYPVKFHAARFPFRILVLRTGLRSGLNLHLSYDRIGHGRANRISYRASATLGSFREWRGSEYVARHPSLSSIKRCGRAADAQPLGHFPAA